MKPNVTVILPVYNALPFLPEAVNSVLNQRLDAFEVIAIDDGSTDGSYEYLKSLNDRRLTVNRQSHRGLGSTLDLGLQLCKTPYAARMDADDVMHRDRLSKQLEFLAKNADVVMAGTNIDYIVGDKRISAIEPFPLQHWEICRKLYAGMFSVCHPTLMMRTESARAVRGYRVKGAGEDLDFCLRMCEAGRVANLPDVLYHYRIHGDSISATRRDEVRVAHGYALCCAQARKRGVEEPEFEAYAAEWPRTQNWFARVGVVVRDYGAGQYRQAFGDLANKRWMKAVMRLAAAGVLLPRESWYFVRVKASHLAKGRPW